MSNGILPSRWSTHENTKLAAIGELIAPFDEIEFQFTAVKAWITINNKLQNQRFRLL